MNGMQEACHRPLDPKPSMIMFCQRAISVTLTAKVYQVSIMMQFGKVNDSSCLCPNSSRTGVLDK